ncbi:unnamed protein product [Owenia fusiformis]|uniref:Uncharacterized protein n=1 Tax=Owenia fusiformis TaxID=6347 RepID=A0A8S4NN91_OWEFU|nr:unnamed protein product [Owenia fusiformis]
MLNGKMLLKVRRATGFGQAPYRRYRGMKSNFLLILWGLCMLSMISVLIIYLYISKNNEKVFHNASDIHYTDIDDTPKSVPGATEVEELDEAKALDFSLTFTTLVDNKDVALQRGWWMPHVRWKEAVECDNQEWGICAKVLSVSCKPESIRAIYQFIPILNEAPLRGFYFSVRSSGKYLKKIPNPDRGHTEFFYGAVAVIRFMDFSNHTLQLNFSPSDENLYMHSEIHYMLPPGDLKVTSVTIMLGCYGYAGLVKFTDINLKPIRLQERNEIPRELTPFDFISKCPQLPSPLPKVPKFKTQQFLISNDKFDSHMLSLVTLVTQLSMDRLNIAAEILQNWDGPISLAIYVPAGDSNNQWKEQYVHKKLQGIKIGPHCDVTVMYGIHPDERYPINMLRNAAVRSVRTEYMFLVDADFLPSPNFQEIFDMTLKANFKKRSHESFDKTAFVVPAFEYMEDPEPTDPLAHSKAELLEIVLNEQSNIEVFRILESPDAHKPTDYQRWYTNSKIYRIKNYQDKYEPYVVLRKNDKVPLYDERFDAYGMNKVSFIMELKAAGYEFLVLPDSWAIHLPHMPTPFNFAFLNSPLERLRNRVLRFEFNADLSRKYRIGGCVEQIFMK